jgi:hypothetical protein
MALDYIEKQTDGEYGVRGGVFPMQQLDETVDELQARTKHYHRMVINKYYKLLFDCPIIKGILPPVTDLSEIRKLALNEEAKL